MNNSNITFDGMEEVLAALESLNDLPKLEAALGRACALVERAAKQKAPKDTGALRNSIASRIENNGGKLEGVVFTPLEYAPYVEYGTGLFAGKAGARMFPGLIKMIRVNGTEQAVSILSLSCVQLLMKIESKLYVF